MNQHEQNNQNNQFQPYNYSFYEQKTVHQGFVEESRLQGIVRGILNRPLVATGTLILASTILASAFIFGGGAEDGSGPKDLPIIKADASQYKAVPDQPGGMDIPNQDSTIFAGLNEGRIAETPPVQNLLEQEEPADQLEAFAEEVEQIIAEEESVAEVSEQSQDTAEAAPEGVDAAEQTAQAETASMPQPEEIQQVPMTVESVQPKVENFASRTVPAGAAPQKQTPTAALHPPASSPETLEFVRSVLDKKDTKQVLNSGPSGTSTASNDNAARVAAIAPAAGAAGIAGQVINSGNYFVQLASVTTENDAKVGWAKFQNTYNAQLSGVSYRVQEANLGAKGTFFRIQAGPMSKDDADRICNEIKAQKPGGCLVVK